MKIAAITAAICVLVAPAGSLSRNAPGSPPLVLKGGTLIDGNGGPVLPGRTIVIENGLIADIYRDGEKPAPAGADIRDVSGHFILPGFIESHAHIGGSPDECLTWALEGGVTILREMAGDGAYLRDLQQAVVRGELAAPDIYFSAVMGGPELIQKDARARMATPPSYLLGKAPWMRQVDETSDLAEIVREAKACGATAIKLYADMSAGLVARLTAEAHRQGMKVWAHSVISPANIEDIVAAGVDSVSHAVGFLLPPDWTFRRDDSLAMDPRLANPQRLTALAETMKKHETFFDPTLSVFHELAGRIADPQERKQKEALWSGVVRQLHQAGVAIVAGTDCPLPGAKGSLPAVHGELRLLVEQGGLAPLEAITAATKNAARMLGLDQTRGTLERGKAADLVILKSDPLADIANTTSIAFVVKKGKIVV